MASSSDNLIPMESWLLRSTFSDAWMMTEEAFTRDNDIFARALQETFSDNNNNQSAHHAFDNQLYPTPTRFQTPTPTFSGGSETNTVVSKGKKSTTTTTAAPAATVGAGINSGKITKRKRRKSKRSTTTVIMADPANFRWMVQEVTGFRLEGNLQLPVFNPDPELRPDSNLMQQSSSSCLLPTFDTSSALLLETTNQQQHVEGQPAVSVGVPSGQPETVHGGGFDFGSFCNFPTLDSWNV